MVDFKHEAINTFIEILWDHANNYFYSQMGLKM